jgi:CRISPR-associated protein Cas1
VSSLFKGRLGIAQARIPHADRHGLLWLEYGALRVEDGTLHFSAANSPILDAGDYSIPYQGISMILLGPGTALTHDVLRVCAHQGVLLCAVGEAGVKLYSMPPFGQAHSEIAREHARQWADPAVRLDVARRMYGWRFGKILPHKDISTLRGIEGARMKETYAIQAKLRGLSWNGRHYDRANPAAADVPNQALNHAATFVEAAAEIAVAAVGALPPLGFIHEDSSNAFTLDIADLYRAEVTIPIAFDCAVKTDGVSQLEREVRKHAVKVFRKEKVISRLIDRIKALFDGTSDRHHP